MRRLAALLPLGLLACATAPPAPKDSLQQPASALVAGEVVAVAYSGFRPGQHPDRGEGAIEPSDEEILEDLRLLVQGGFRLVRLYDSGGASRRTLALARAHQLPIRVMLGAWLQAEVSNHEGCPWLDAPIPAETLAANAAANAEELARAIELANAYPELVVAVNVGNEALVSWNDHMVSLEATLAYIAQVKAAIRQPVTVADNYVVWAEHPALGRAVDFAAVHTYPVWEGKDIDEGMAFTLDNLARVRAANPDLTLAIGEAGWPSAASEFGPRASQAKQARYFAELTEWARAHHVTVFVFEAFDEAWKGDPTDPQGAEKHWGLLTGERRPKQVVQDRYPERAKAPAHE